MEAESVKELGLRRLTWGMMLSIAYSPGWATVFTQAKSVWEPTWDVVQQIKVTGGYVAEGYDED